jgi:hypothetical protein
MPPSAPEIVMLPPLRVLLVKKADVWVAQCLEYDITAQGKEIDDARKSFERVLLAHVMSDRDANRKPLDGVPPAPADVREMFASSKRLAERPDPYPSSPVHDGAERSSGVDNEAPTSERASRPLSP